MRRSPASGYDARLAMFEDFMMNAVENSAVAVSRMLQLIAPAPEWLEDEVVLEAVQEAYDKWQKLSDLAGLEWAVIGHLQSNKVKYVARFAAEFQALDSLDIAEALDRRLQQEGRSLDVFIQINTSDEPQKYGMTPDAADAFIRALPAYSALRPRGLMTLALFSDDHEAVRRCFIRLRELRDRLRETNPAIAELSMGMSGDFELAIAEGATTVRVGQAIFGNRLDPNAYWPGIK